MNNPISPKNNQEFSFGRKEFKKNLNRPFFVRFCSHNIRNAHIFRAR